MITDQRAKGPLCICYRFPFLTALVIACLAGAAFGWTSPTLRLFERATAPLAVIEMNGQDINGDGIATTEEGRFDVDGDGLFTIVEARSLGMERFINWEFTGEKPEDSAATIEIPNACCVTVIPNPIRPIKACMLNPPMPNVSCLISGLKCKTI